MGMPTVSRNAQKHAGTNAAASRGKLGDDAGSGVVVEHKCRLVYDCGTGNADRCKRPSTSKEVRTLEWDNQETPD